MGEYNRRDFLILGGKLAAIMGLGSASVPRVADALAALADGQTKVLWLQGLSCSGCSVSVLNSVAPDPVSLLTEYISLLFHSTLSTATGHVAMGIVEETLKSEDEFILVFEGAVPVEMPDACRMGHKPITELLVESAQKANTVLATGTCAAFGGIPSAEGNPVGAQSVVSYLKGQRIDTPIIRLPGCPVHPEWLVGTIIHATQFGLPNLDDQYRPTMFYGSHLHTQCPRFADYERERFAKNFSDDGCLFRLGCLGPVTKADCTVRHWNGGANTCIKAGAPCIGCASESFASRRDLPFYPENLSKEGMEA